MSTNTEEVSRNMSVLVDDARALLNATAGMAGEKVIEARRRLSAALGSGRELYANARQKAVAKAKVADEAVRAHPYRAIGVAFGVGALLAFFLTRRDETRRQNPEGE